MQIEHQRGIVKPMRVQVSPLEHMDRGAQNDWLVRVIDIWQTPIDGPQSDSQGQNEHS